MIVKCFSILPLCTICLCLARITFYWHSRGELELDRQARMDGRGSRRKVRRNKRRKNQRQIKCV